MLRLSLRGLLARRTRLVLTSLAVALGVALVAGTYVFTDTINRSFDQLFTASVQGTDVAVRPVQRIDVDDENDRGTLPAAVLERVRGVEGVAAAGGQAEGIVTAFGPDGEKLSSGVAPSFAGSIAEDPRFDTSLEVVDGRRPRGTGEALLDASTATGEGIAVGERISVQGVGERRTLTVVGTSRVAGVGSLGGAVAIGVTLPEAQALLGQQGRLDGVQVAAADGVAPAELADRVAAAAGRGVEVRTGEADAASQSATLREDLGVLNTGLLAFAGISLFVGAFLIYNTFAITVAQRTREIALLRTLGASRPQVLRSVLAEGAVLGALGAVVGLGLGVLAAAGLRALFSSIGLDLPSTGTVILARTVIVSLAVGIVMTLVAALAPALRATRVAPIEALQEAAAPSRRPPSRRLAIAAAALTALGLVLICVGLFASDTERGALSALGLGSVATFLGVALASPRLVGPLARIVGAPIERLGGLTGRLARENAVRQPGRTATTASALMVGVALVAFAGIFAASARQTIASIVEGNLRAQVIVQNEDGFSPFPSGALERVRQVDGVRTATGVRFATARLGAEDHQPVSGIDPVAFPEAYAVDEGAFARLRAGDTVLVAEDKAAEDGLRTGQALAFGTQDGGTVRLRVAGTFADDGGLTAPFVVSMQTLERGFDERQDAFGLVVLDEGADPVAARGAIDDALEGPFPVAEAQTADEFVEAQSGQVDQLLGLIYALLSLSVLVAFVGIVNTLVLSVRERTRELGLLRAIGTSRRQIRATVRWEALITALIGAVLGLVVGTALAVLFTQPLDDFELAIPVGSLLTLLLVAAVAGVLAAAWPARRAARLDVLQALAHE